MPEHLVSVDVTALEIKVRDMYRLVAEHPEGRYHFELGTAVAERVGYDPRELAHLPEAAVASFAGVGYFFDLADLKPGETVVDLGSGSGMDVFLAAHLVGTTGRVVGVDFTPEQLSKSKAIAAASGIDHAEFIEGRIEAVPVGDASVDCVISNGVINLCPDKSLIFAEISRLLRPGGRLAIADIVTETQLSEAIVCDADLWAACIGGAAQIDTYLRAIASAGLVVEQVRQNDYGFVSPRARTASANYGVQSVSILARKATPQP